MARSTSLMIVDGKSGGEECLCPGITEKGNRLTFSKLKGRKKIWHREIKETEGNVLMSHVNMHMDSLIMLLDINTTNIGPKHKTSQNVTVVTTQICFITFRDDNYFDRPFAGAPTWPQLALLCRLFSDKQPTLVAFFGTVVQSLWQGSTH